jgi:hypothetical protein
MLNLIDEKDLKLNQDKINAIYFYRDDFLQHHKVIFNLSKYDKKLNIITIDIGHFPNMTMRFRLINLPTIIFYKKRKEIKRLCKIVENKRFEKIVDDILLRKGGPKNE